MVCSSRYAATEIAIIELIYSSDISCKTTHRMVKYLNNIIEQDHRFIKQKVKPMLGFDNFESAKKTIACIEAMHMIRKGQVHLVWFKDSSRILWKRKGICLGIRPGKHMNCSMLM